jgi:hypothetical protein
MNRHLVDSSKSTLLMLNDSHTSVLGLRQIASVDRIVVADFEELSDFLDKLVGKDTSNGSRHANGGKSCLFVMTAMSNFCGRIYDLTVATRIKAGNFKVIIGIQIIPFSSWPTLEGLFRRSRFGCPHYKHWTRTL